MYHLKVFFSVLVQRKKISCVFYLKYLFLIIITLHLSSQKLHKTIKDVWYQPGISYVCHMCCMHVKWSTVTKMYLVCTSLIRLFLRIGTFHVVVFSQLIYLFTRVQQRLLMHVC